MDDFKMSSDRYLQCMKIIVVIQRDAKIHQSHEIIEHGCGF